MPAVSAGKEALKEFCERRTNIMLHAFAPNDPQTMVCQNGTIADPPQRRPPPATASPAIQKLGSVSPPMCRPRNSPLVTAGPPRPPPLPLPSTWASLCWWNSVCIRSAGVHVGARASKAETLPVKPIPPKVRTRGHHHKSCAADDFTHSEIAASPNVSRSTIERAMKPA